MGNRLIQMEAAKTTSGAVVTFIVPEFATHAYISFFIPRLPTVAHTVKFRDSGAVQFTAPVLTIHSLGTHKALFVIPSGGFDLLFTTSGISTTGNYIMKADFVVRV